MNPRLSRKKELAKRTLIYGIMTMSVLALLTILMMMVMGYQFDLKTRSVEQTGLVQYDSFPSSARVAVDGTTLGSRTQTKNTVIPGKHQFAMQLNGYEPWQKTVDVSAGAVTWLNYIRFVPVEKEVVSTYSLPSVDKAVASPDRRYMVLWRQDDQGPILELLDFRSSGSPQATEYRPTTQQMAGLDPANLAEQHKIDSVRWSGDSRYVVVKHTYQLKGTESKSEWLWIDRESPDTMVNLSSFFGLEFDDVQPLNSPKVMVLANQDIREASVGDGVISVPRATGVQSFTVRDNDIFSYIAKEGEATAAGVWRRGEEPMVFARSLVESDGPMHIVVNRYFNKDTVAVSVGQRITYYRGDVPTSEAGLTSLLQTARSFAFHSTLTNLQFSSNGRFLIAEDDNSFVSYDLERLEVSQNIPKHATSPLKWLDGYHVVQVDSSGNLLMQEFDGLNNSVLMSANTSLDSLLTNDGKYVYTWLTSDGVIELKRLSMTIG